MELSASYEVINQTPSEYLVLVAIHKDDKEPELLESLYQRKLYKPWDMIKGISVSLREQIKI